MRTKTALILVTTISWAGCGGDVGLFGEHDGTTDSSVPDTITDTATDQPTACPAGIPASGSVCDVEGLVCEYGSETCCGVTYPSMVCQCFSETFSCYYTDACMGSPFGCDCVVDSDCEPGGWGRAWCVDGACVPCDDSGRDCLLACEHGFVPERNGCQPCECDDDSCVRDGEGYCTCDAVCSAPGATCEAGLGRCVPNICGLLDCSPGYTCDQLRGCVEAECVVDPDCKLIYSSCGCQAVPASDPRDALDPCDHDGGEVCAYNSCVGDGVMAVCRSAICTEQYGPGCGG